MSKSYAMIIQVFASAGDVLLIWRAEKRYLQTRRVCDVVGIPQLRMETATSRPLVQKIRVTVNPLKGFDDAHQLPGVGLTLQLATVIILHCVTD